MAFALVFNPGSNSLKFELIDVKGAQEVASDASMTASAVLDGIGKETTLSVYRGRTVVDKQPCQSADMGAATEAALAWLREQNEAGQVMEALEFVAVRVVHGGPYFDGPAEATREVRQTIQELEELAPLHNRGPLEVLQVLDRVLPGARQMVAFDTSFHRSLPEVAWRYPIERQLADREGVRKFGFHGLSHRYQLEQYARAVGKRPEACTVVTLHLESGSSACAIRYGRSVDTTMGMTPLEGLMMGSRSGSIDPAIIPYLMKKQDQSVGQVMEMLNKRSGLLGIAGGTLDTRDLVKREDGAAKLALEMFSYRVRLAVGAYLAALGEECEAVIFGGGIGEDSPWLRKAVCAGLTAWGLELDEEVNSHATAEQVAITTGNSRLQAWAMPVEEGLQIAHECAKVLESLA